MPVTLPPAVTKYCWTSGQKKKDGWNQASLTDSTVPENTNIMHTLLISIQKAHSSESYKYFPMWLKCLFYMFMTSNKYKPVHMSSHSVLHHILCTLHYILYNLSNILCWDVTINVCASLVYRKKGHKKKKYSHECVSLNFLSMLPHSFIFLSDCAHSLLKSVTSTWVEMYTAPWGQCTQEFASLICSMRAAWTPPFICVSAKQLWHQQGMSNEAKLRS